MFQGLSQLHCAGQRYSALLALLLFTETKAFPTGLATPRPAKPGGIIITININNNNSMVLDII